jgi:hypothetical protein
MENHSHPIESNGISRCAALTSNLRRKIFQISTMNSRWRFQFGLDIVSRLTVRGKMVLLSLNMARPGAWRRRSGEFKTPWAYREESMRAGRF